MEPLGKLQRLLRELFEFNSADLDFGIYRVMNYKRDVIEKFIKKDLVRVVSAELDSGTLAEQSEAVRKLQEVKERILRDLGEDAIDGDGNLVEQYHTTRVGKEYLDLKSKATGARARPALEAMIFNHLYTFFSRYYDNGDFMSKRRYSKKERYAIPYNGEETHLHWANSDQYYTKTGEYFTDYKFNSRDITVHFKLQNAEVEQDNVKGDKRFFVPLVKKADFDAKGKQIVVPFEYRPLTEQEEIAYGKKNQQETIIAKTLRTIPKQLKKDKRALSALLAERRKTAKGEPVSYLEHHLRQYTRRNTSDFFIHKDLKGFLERELDFYIKNEVLNIDELEAAGEVRSEGWFQLMRVIKIIGHRIIEFLAQIENFQKKLFEKKKFVTETNYCITVGNMAEDFYEEIVANDAQWQEWKELFHIDEEQRNLFTSRSKGRHRAEFLKTHPTLVLDTRHFDVGFIDCLLASFDNLDEQIDGLLVHSENFQALNLLREKYREKAKCIYIDPPYNTGSDEFVYKDNYQHSTWLTMMKNRLMLAQDLWEKDGVFFVSIDDNEVTNLLSLMNHIFGEENFISNLAIVNNISGRSDRRNIATAHEHMLMYEKGNFEAIGLPLPEEYEVEYTEEDEHGRYRLQGLRKRGSGARREDRPNLFYPFYYDPKTDSLSLDRKKDFTKIVPKLSDGRDGRWRWGKDTVRKRMDKLVVRKVSTRGEYDVFQKDYLGAGGLKRRIKAKSVWLESRYSSDFATTAYKKVMKTPYKNPKSPELIKDIINLSTKGDDLIIDFFAGSGTTAISVLNLNREDYGERKYVLVEMGEYFDTVLLPRIKKVTFTPEWENGKPKRQATQEEADQSPRIVKYVRLESYEDALNNVRFDEKMGQRALQFDDYLVRYMLGWEASGSETLLNVEKLASPYSYKLILNEGQEKKEKFVNLPETFNYLLGLNIKTRRVYSDGARRYLVYRGTIDHREVVVIWRDTKGWGKKDFERDKKFVDDQKFTEGADEIFINGDSFVPDAKALEPVFKSRMFGGL